MAGSLTRTAALAAAAVALCLLAVSSLLPALAQEKTDDAFFASLSDDPRELDKAAKDAAEASRLNPLSVEPLLVGSGIAEKRGRYDRAGQLLIDAAGRQPDNPEVWLYAARLQILRDDAPGVRTATLKLFELDPFNSVVPFLYSSGVVEERVSASATGTPLPERIGGPPRRQPAQNQPAPAPPAPTPPPAATPSPSPAPTPAPAPAPTPAPTPQPEPQEEPEPFRLEG